MFVAGLQVRQLTPRSRVLQSTTPFVQSECTGGYLCGTEFQQQGCYASPDYSTCSYNAAVGQSYCTVCICYGSDSGVCDTSSGSTTGTSQPDIYTGDASTRTLYLSFKSLVVLWLFCVWFNAFGFFCCFWYFCSLFLFWCFFISLIFQISHVRFRFSRLSFLAFVSSIPHFVRLFFNTQLRSAAFKLLWKYFLLEATLVDICVVIIFTSS